MQRVSLSPESSVLVVVDIQERLVPSIHESDRVVARAAFLARIARLLDIPILATEQNPTKMGPTEPRIRSVLAEGPVSKMSFSCCGSQPFLDALERLGTRQVVIVGIETHICVALTANDLLGLGYEVVVCPDATSARSMERHKLGMERIRDAGAAPAHTESVAYEWLGGADNPKFREALEIVKAFSG